MARRRHGRPGCRRHWHKAAAVVTGQLELPELRRRSVKELLEPPTRSDVYCETRRRRSAACGLLECKKCAEMVFVHVAGINKMDNLALLLLLIIQIRPNNWIYLYRVNIE